MDNHKPTNGEEIKCPKCGSDWCVEVAGWDEKKKLVGTWQHCRDCFEDFNHKKK